MEIAKSRAGWAERVELRHDGVGGEDGRAAFGMTRDDEARSWELGMGADGSHLADRGYF